MATSHETTGEPDEPAPPRPRLPPWLIAVLLGQAALGFAYTWLIPIDRGPDEPHHLAYVVHLDRFRSLPHLTSVTAARDERTGAIAIHPPLYYLACLPAYELIKHWPRSLVERCFRWLALLLAAGTLLLTYRLVSALFPDRPALVAATLVVVAFLPEFQLLSAVMNNDGLLMLLSTWLALLLCRAAAIPPTVVGWLHLGLLQGACVLTKATAAAVVPVAPAIMLAHAMARRARWSGLPLRLLAYCVPPVAMTGWWFYQIKATYGRWHPIWPWKGHPLIHDSLVDLLVSDHGWLCVKRFLVGVQMSIWGQVDWFLPTVKQYGAALYPLTHGLYLAFTLLMFLSMGGLCLVAVRQRRGPRALAPQQAAGVSVAAAYFLLLYLALAHYTLFVHPGGYQGGRYLLPAVACYGLLFALGLHSLLPLRWQRHLPWVLAAALVAWNLACMVNLAAFLNPLYAPGEGIELLVR